MKENKNNEVVKYLGHTKIEETLNTYGSIINSVGE